MFTSWDKNLLISDQPQSRHRPPMKTDFGRLTFIFLTRRLFFKFLIYFHSPNIVFCGDFVWWGGCRLLSTSLGFILHTRLTPKVSHMGQLKTVDFFALKAPRYTNRWFHLDYPANHSADFSLLPFGVIPNVIKVFSHLKSKNPSAITKTRAPGHVIQVPDVWDQLIPKHGMRKLLRDVTKGQIRHNRPNQVSYVSTLF